MAIAARLKAKWALPEAKIVLITDACYLTRPKVAAALNVMVENNGEIWAKLDAGTEEHFRKINRPNFPLRHVVDTITSAAQRHPVCIQSLWMRLHGEPPGESEVEAFGNRLMEIVTGGGRISLVQVYTIARQPTESYVTPLAADELERIAARIRHRTGLTTAIY